MFVGALILPLLLLFLLSLSMVPQPLVEGHGRMLEPPARNTLWRFGFKAQTNYNDNELFCGGIGGITRNEGKCGICGDPYDGPRLHETGGKMVESNNQTQAPIRNYFPGSSIDLMIEIVANHGGQFKFDICWRDKRDEHENEDCFEQLRFSNSDKQQPQVVNNIDNNGNNTNNNEILDSENIESYYYDLDPASGTGVYTMSVDLPSNKTCEACILRWHWRAANNWGTCDDGSEAIGCGHQEVYRNCADISVRRSSAGIRLGATINR